MAGLPGLLRTFQDFQQIQANTYAAAANTANLPVADLGSFAPLGAIFNATAMADLAVQAEIDYVAALSRLGTSAGTDVDTYVSPFIGPRQGAGEASGVGTYSLNSAVSGRTLALQVGAIIQRNSDGFQYQVISDTSGVNAAYDAASNAYYFQAAGAQSITFSFQALTAGSVGNTEAGTITTPFGGPGVSTVTLTGTITNASPVINGTDAETDAAYIARFQAEMAGGSVGTAYAYYKAGLSVAEKLTVSIGDTLDALGSEKLSWFTVFVNVLGQSAGPSTTLLAQVQAAVEAVRAAGTRFSVVSPTLLQLNITGALHSDGSTATADMVTNAIAAATAYVNDLGMVPIQNYGSITTIQLPLSLINKAIMGAAGVAYTSTLQVNSSFSDVTIGYGTQAIVASCAFTTE